MLPVHLKPQVSRLKPRKRSGKGTTLPSFPPLRTVRESFPSYGSSDFGTFLRLLRLPNRRRAYGYLFATTSTSNLRSVSPPPVGSQHSFELSFALSDRLCIPVVFRLSAFASSNVSYPLGNCAALAIGLPANRTR